MSANSTLSESLSQLAGTFEVLITLKRYKELSYFLELYIFPIGILSNILHFIILCRKRLRQDVIFQFFIGISVVNILKILFTAREQMEEDRRDPNFCTGYSSFFNTVLNLMASFFEDVVDSSIYFYVVIIGVVSFIISKFPSGTWAKSLSKPSFIVEIILSTMVVISVYNFLLTFYSKKISSMTGNETCTGVRNISEINRDEQFKIVYYQSEYPAFTQLLTNMSAATRICFPIVYILLIIVLIKGWIRYNRTPTILVLFFLVSYLLVDLPFLFIEYFLPFFFGVVTSWQYLKAVIIIASFRTYVKLFIASINIVIFIVLSSEYRKEILNIFGRKKKVHLVNAATVATD